MKSIISKSAHQAFFILTTFSYQMCAVKHKYTFSVDCRAVYSSGKGAAHFVSFCDMAFSALFRIFLLLSLFIAFFVLNLEKSGKRSTKGCKSRKSHAPLSFCILFQCVKIS